MPDALLEINRRRYAAEVEFSQKKNTRLTYWMDQGKSATYARAQAEVDAKEEYEAWLNVKAEYHYAEDIQKALHTKINSMLNINKSVASQYGSYR